MIKPDSTDPRSNPNAAAPVAEPAAAGPETPAAGQPAKRPREIGGPSGLEPTRYGDWERNGRVSDF